MKNGIYIILGLLIILIGFRTYNYYEKNYPESDFRSKKFAKSVIIILSGIGLLTLAIISNF